MPKDFLCDRISEDSPLRFLDFDIGNYIHSKYRPSIPYLLEAVVFNDGQCRRAGNKKKVVKKTNENRHTAHWQRVKNLLVPTISWRDFQLCMDIIIQSKMAEQLYRNSYMGGENWKQPYVSSNIVPSIEIDFGDRKQLVQMGGKLSVGGHDFMPQCIRMEKDKNDFKIRSSHYPVGQKNMEDWIQEHLYRMAHYAYYDYSKYDFLYDELGDKRKSIWQKKAGVGSYWQLPSKNKDMLNEAMLFPRVPNIYQKKDDILEIIKLEYGLDEKEIKKLKNKYTVKQLIKMYWKELVDCV